MVKHFLNSAFWNRISDLKLHLASENRKTKSSKKVFFKQKMWSLSHDTKCCNCCHRNYLPLATALALALSRSLSRSLSLSLSLKGTLLSLSLSLWRIRSFLNCFCVPPLHRCGCGIVPLSSWGWSPPSSFSSSRPGQRRGEEGERGGTYWHFPTNGE